MSDQKAAVNPLFLREEYLRQGMELLFFAYRDFTSEADAVLAKQNFGRAHHRVIYFVGRHPNIGVSELLSILGITKQSLSRVLSQLVREGYIEQRPGVKDRRQRLLCLTTKGHDLEAALTTAQRRRLAVAFKEAGAEAVEGFRKVMVGIMDEDARHWFDPAETADRAKGRS